MTDFLRTTGLFALTAVATWSANGVAEYATVVPGVVGPQFRCDQEGRCGALLGGIG